MSNEKINALQAAVVTASFNLLIAECALLVEQEKFSMVIDKSVNWLMNNFRSVASVYKLKVEWSEFQISIYQEKQKHNLSQSRVNQLMSRFEDNLCTVMKSQVSQEYYDKWVTASKMSQKVT